MKKLIIPLLLMPFIFGCSDSINGVVINQAVDLCKKDGGVHSASISALLAENYVICNNGKKVKGKAFTSHIIRTEKGQ